jgi:hypothetical protein
MVDDLRQSILPDHGRESIPAFQHWIKGFTLQTLVYGINVVLFVMTFWVLVIHILKGSTSHRFHRHHLLQNCILLVYVVVMFALSSVFMGHQGIIAGNTWSSLLDVNGSSNVADIVETAFEEQVALQRACNAILILVNWGTVALLVCS